MIGVTSNIFTCLKKNNIVLGFSVWSVGHLRFWHKKEESNFLFRKFEWTYSRKFFILF